MYILSASFLPVTLIFAAFTMTTGSPVSRLGVNETLCLPRNVAAACVERRPSTAPSASMTRQWRSISLAFALCVLVVIAVIFFSPRSFVLVVRHAHQTQAPCRRRRSGLRAILRSHDLAEPLDTDLAASHPEEGPHDRPDHSSQEGVGLDLESEELTVAGPRRPSHRSNGPAGAVTGGERGEVRAPDQTVARLVHRIQPQRGGMV